MNNKVYACIDGRTNTSAVIDASIWSAQQLCAPLEFLHVLERPTQTAALVDYSGAIGLGAQDSLLQELSDLDEKRGRLAQEAGRQLLSAARERAAAVGIGSHDARLRHGDLTEAVIEVEPDTRLFVLGEHFHAQPRARQHLDHRVERVLRIVHKPVLVVTGNSFTKPQRFVLAYDGSATARKAIERVASSPLLKGLPVLVAMAGSDAAAAARQLSEAGQVLANAGFAAETRHLNGEPEVVLPALLKDQADSLLVMGAYGHSRIRQLIVGSTTTTLLRTAEVPVLILR